jgi:hypothetical protein
MAHGMLADLYLIQAIKDALSNTGCGSEGPMDKDVSDSDSGETDSESSNDKTQIPDSNYASVQDFDDTHMHDFYNNGDPDPDDDYRCIPQQPPNLIKDDDCGPIESGPLMNEIHFIARKGQSETPTQLHTITQILPTAPT